MIKKTKVKNDRLSKVVILLERQLQNDVYKLFNKLFKNLSNILNKELKFTDKENIVLNEIDIEIEENNKLIIEKIIYRSNKWIKLWNKFINRTLNTWIWFNLIDSEVEKYFDKLTKLYLSDKLEWSILKTTKNRILKQIKKDFKDDVSLSKIIKNLEKNFALSKWRAKLIWIAEIWKAYEFWKEQTMKKYQWENPKDKVIKSWLTVWDNRVTLTHTINSWDWWIKLNKSFSWTWDKAAPWSDNARCRCSTIYDII